MRIAVCIKQILDPETIKVSRSQQAIDDRKAKKIMNPPDRWALDAALRFKEADPATEIVAISLGEPEAEDCLREALAMGCDRAILLNDPLLAKAQSAAIAKVMAAAIKRLRDVQVVMTGYLALDSGSGSLGPRLAIELGDWPVLMAATDIRIESGHLQGLQYMDDTYYAASYPLPAVVTVLETPVHPRYPHGSQIINAYRLRAVERWSSLSLGLDPKKLPAPTTQRQLRLPPEREMGVRFEGDPESAAQSLVAALKSRRVI